LAHAACDACVVGQPVLAFFQKPLHKPLSAIDIPDPHPNKPAVGPVKLRCWPCRDWDMTGEFLPNVSAKNLETKKF
jgi:hypothetical protein